MIGRVLLALALLTTVPMASAANQDYHIGVCATHLWLTNQEDEGKRLLTRVQSSKDMRRSALDFTVLIRKDPERAMDQAAKSCKILNQPLFSDDTQ